MSEKGSLVARLREQREAAMQQEKVLTLGVPGWSGMVSVRYKPVEWERLTALLAEQGGDAKAALGSNLDALASACDAILVKDEGDARPHSLADALREQGETVHGEVRFDAYAVDALALEVKSDVPGQMRAPKDGAETVLAVFAGAISPELAVAEHAAHIGAWMRGVSSEVDTSLAGERASPKSS